MNHDFREVQDEMQALLGEGESFPPPGARLLSAPHAPLRPSGSATAAGMSSLPSPSAPASPPRPVEGPVPTEGWQEEDGAAGRGSPNRLAEGQWAGAEDTADEPRNWTVILIVASAMALVLGLSLAGLWAVWQIVEALRGLAELGGGV